MLVEPEAEPKTGEWVGLHEDVKRAEKAGVNAGERECFLVDPLLRVMPRLHGAYNINDRVSKCKFIVSAHISPLVGFSAIEVGK